MNLSRTEPLGLQIHEDVHTYHNLLSLFNIQEQYQEHESK